MTHVFALFAIHADASEPFVRYIRGEWHSLARLQRDLIATDLLEQKTDAGHTLLCRSTRLFVALDFWTTHEAYLRASRSAECQALLLQRRIWAKFAFEFEPSNTLVCRNYMTRSHRARSASPPLQLARLLRCHRLQAAAPRGTGSHPGMKA